MKRANTRQSRKGSMPDDELIGRTLQTLQQIREDVEPMEVVEDHHICYGTKKPLCKVKLGGRGITKDVLYITCPECLIKMQTKTDK